MKISNFRLAIAIPLTYHMVPSAFFDSFIAMEKPDFHYFRASSGSVDDMRNELTAQAMASGCTHIIFMDTDQCYPPETIPKLLSHKLPVVGGLVHRRYPAFEPLLMQGSIDAYTTIEEWAPGSLVEVDATGTGCLLFDMDIFRKMPGPWFRFRTEGGKPVGEDIGFCSDLKAAGYRIFVDTSIEIGHLSQFQVTGGTWQLFQAVEREKLKRFNAAKEAT